MWIWWRLVQEESAGQTKPPHCKPNCCRVTLRGGKRKVKVSLMLVVSPHQQQSDQQDSTGSRVYCKDDRRVVHLLLMLAGDVESNPGPEGMTGVMY